MKWEWLDQRSWCRDNDVQTFHKAVKESLAQLKLWSRNELGDRKKQVDMLVKELKIIKQNHLQYVDGAKIKSIEKQIDVILIEEEIYWKQRSRADWLKEGDRNTKFFHVKASVRKKNKIWGILDDEDKWTKEAEDVERIFCDYFANLFTSTYPTQAQVEAALQGIPIKITKEMNEILDHLFSEDEISAALFQMCPTKAPGPDELPAAFFQKHWKSVGKGVLTTCVHILNDGGSIAPLNHTPIALIPKVKKPRKVTEYRPISLCNVIYRIVAKTIANRLKQILHLIIAPTQSAFVPNRLITDNIIIGYECLHKIRSSKSKKGGLITLKLDISKAYDMVEWRFLESTLRRLGVSKKWVDLIMRCITTSSFSVLINGVAKGLIHPQRGLRQGCLLSPYLFILCAEMFSNLLLQAESQQLIHGLKFSKDLSITHLLFADDSLFSPKLLRRIAPISRLSSTVMRQLRDRFLTSRSLQCFSVGTPQLVRWKQ